MNEHDASAPTVDDALLAIAFQGQLAAAHANGIPTSSLARLLGCTEEQATAALAEADAQSTTPSWIPSEAQHDLSFSLWAISDAARRRPDSGSDWATQPMSELDDRSPVDAIADGDLEHLGRVLRGD